MLLLHLGFCPEVGNILNGKVSHVTPQVGKAAIEFRKVQLTVHYMAMTTAMVQKQTSLVLQALIYLGLRH